MSIFSDPLSRRKTNVGQGSAQADTTPMEITTKGVNTRPIEKAGDMGDKREGTIEGGSDVTVDKRAAKRYNDSGQLTKRDIRQMNRAPKRTARQKRRQERQVPDSPKQNLTENQKAETNEVNTSTTAGPAEATTLRELRMRKRNEKGALRRAIRGATVEDEDTLREAAEALEGTRGEIEGLRGRKQAARRVLRGRGKASALQPKAEAEAEAEAEAPAAEEEAPKSVAAQSKARTAKAASAAMGAASQPKPKPAPPPPPPPEEPEDAYVPRDFDAESVDEELAVDKAYADKITPVQQIRQIAGTQAEASINAMLTRGGSREIENALGQYEDANVIPSLSRAERQTIANMVQGKIPEGVNPSEFLAAVADEYLYIVRPPEAYTQQNPTFGFGSSLGATAQRIREARQRQLDTMSDEDRQALADYTEAREQSMGRIGLNQDVVLQRAMDRLGE